MNEVIERLKVKFAGEAAVTLDLVAAWLEDARRGGSRQELIDRVREEAHGLKGAAAMLEFTEFRDAAAALEQAAAELCIVDPWPDGAFDRLAALLDAASAVKPGH